MENTPLPSPEPEAVKLVVMAGAPPYSDTDVPESLLVADTETETEVYPGTGAFTQVPMMFTPGMSNQPCLGSSTKLIGL